VSVSTSDIASGTLSFIDVAAAQSSKAGMAALRSRAGEQVTLEGFVWRQDGAAADEILLTRYVVTCCVADATSAQVRVVNVPPGRFAPDDWVSVTGRIYPLGSEILVDASAVRAIPQPERPYLTP
jgi:putative membrane protein